MSQEDATLLHTAYNQLQPMTAETTDFHLFIHFVLFNAIIVVSAQ